MSAPADGACVDVSIVVATCNPRDNLVAWLDAVAPQLVDRAAEVLVCANPGEALTYETAVASRSAIRIIESREPRLIPERWGLAVAAARGRLVAITISACVPAAGWVDAILDAHRDEAAGIGGAIENDPSSGIVDWAVYFVRYTPYMLPFAAGPVKEIAGDNGTYKRADLVDLMPEIRSRGFWETDVNAALRARGRRLLIDPRIVVRHRRSFRLGAFSRQRFRHGRLFGAGRAAGRSAGRRALRIAAAPILPFVLTARAARTVTATRRHRAAFVKAAPLTWWFFACWTMGETIGVMRGAR